MARATRFVLRAPARYRASDGPWLRGVTENISRSGVLVRAAEAVVPDTPLEIVVELGSVLPETPANLVCRGRSVRVVFPQEANGPVMFAATIDDCELNRLDDVAGLS